MISKPPNISSASAKSKPCFRILERFFASSHSKVIVTPIVATYKRFIHAVAFGVSVVAFLVSLHLPVHLAYHQAGFQFEINRAWISNPNIHYHMGVDGISM